VDHIILDTDVCSFLLKGDTRIQGYQTHLIGRIPCLSFQTVAELQQWAEARSWGAARREQMDEWLGCFVILYPDLQVCRLWGYIRTECERNGHLISPQDAWIAACAQRYGYPLITHNSDDYRHVSDLQVVTLSDTKPD
jgi:predicted nucleic acid-binding protein